MFIVYVQAKAVTMSSLLNIPSTQQNALGLVDTQHLLNIGMDGENQTRLGVINSNAQRSLLGNVNEKSRWAVNN